MVVAGGDMASFELIDQAGRVVRSSDLAGSWFLLYWYPMADTPGCTAQALGLNDQIDAFDELGCTILGASFDEPSVNAAFLERYGLQFRLLSDVDRAVARSLGVVESSTAEHSPRIAFLVNPAGVVAVRYDVQDPAFFAELVLDDLEAAPGP